MSCARTPWRKAEGGTAPSRPPQGTAPRNVSATAAWPPLAHRTQGATGWTAGAQGLAAGHVRRVAARPPTPVQVRRHVHDGRAQAKAREGLQVRRRQAVQMPVLPPHKTASPRPTTCREVPRTVHGAAQRAAARVRGRSSRGRASSTAGTTCTRYLPRSTSCQSRSPLTTLRSTTCAGPSSCLRGRRGSATTSASRTAPTLRSTRWPHREAAPLRNLRPPGHRPAARPPAGGVTLDHAA